jgi:hypothetical protein
MAYGRFDPGLLCIRQSDYAYIFSLLQEIYPTLRSHLHDPIPLFTKPLAPGVGLAEVPADGHNFGLSRCQVMARALLDTSEPSSRLTMLQQYFKEQQLDWQHPYLNPGSTNRYPVHLE